jgi:hydroxymethylpyrimidine/phosphomethylpyrimidine kinase
MPKAPPVILTIAGSDNSGGAGIQADLKTFTRLNTYGTTAITCVVAEHPGKVASITPVPPRRVREQIELVFEAFPVAAIKTGMLYSDGIIREVASFLRGLRRMPPLVVDPVMVATSGALLLKPEATRRLRNELLPLATLATPNLDEASLLFGHKIRNVQEAHAAAAACAERWGCSFLVKGGHLNTRILTDVLHHDGKIHIFSAPRVPGVKTHGTGCTFSAAIAAHLGKGTPLPAAVGRAKRYLDKAVRGHFHLGRYTPLNHLQ